MACHTGLSQHPHANPIFGLPEEQHHASCPHLPSLNAQRKSDFPTTKREPGCAMNLSRCTCPAAGRKAALGPGPHGHGASDSGECRPSGATWSAGDDDETSPCSFLPSLPYSKGTSLCSSPMDSPPKVLEVHQHSPHLALGPILGLAFP